MSGQLAWRHLLLGVATLKVSAGLLAIASSLASDPALLSSRLPVFGVYLFLFSGAAALLWFGAHENESALLLGGVFLLVAVAWADTPIEQSARNEGVGETLLFLSFVRVDAFLPYLLWRFAGVFPRSHLLGRARRIHQWGKRLSLAAGSFLFLANLVMVLGRVVPALAERGILGWARETAIGVYWTVLYLLDIAALAFLIVLSRRAGATERRRTTLFIAAVAAGAAPMLLITVGELFSPLITRLWESPRGSFILLLTIDVSLLSVPLTTAYAVLVHRVVDLRFVVRKAMQYALARHTVAAATIVPFLVLIGLLYRSRQETLVSLLGGEASLALLGLTALGLCTIRARHHFLRILDRRFFREQYDAARILSDLAQRLRLSETPQALWEPIKEEILRSLHPVALDLLVKSRDKHEFASVGGEEVALSASGPLLSALSQNLEPLECEPAPSNRGLSHLPDNELDWLADGDYRLLVPIMGGRDLHGVLALGPKESELPFSNEDRRLLMGVAAASALVIETRLSVSSATPPLPDSVQPTRTAPVRRERADDERPSALEALKLAVACSTCGRIYGAEPVACESCGGTLESLNLPRLFRGKFRLERIIGRGGMGIVFLARDLDLGRDVAIKSLPRMSAKYSSFLRQEARVMAAVTHPHLALIFGAESYHRLPLLVFEYLPGGTLSSRIGKGPLPPSEVLKIGAQIADVTDCIHRAGILHRDIKPSNIGFTSQGSPKLLDFGLARLIQAGGLSLEAAATNDEDASPLPRRVAGTLFYLSPEAIRGREPDYSFDLWSLSVSLYEALTGSNPFRGKTTSETLRKIDQESVPDVHHARPDCPPEVSELFRRALHKDIRRRPSSAQELKSEIECTALAAA